MNTIERRGINQYKNRRTGGNGLERSMDLPEITSVSRVKGSTARTLFCPCCSKVRMAMRIVFSKAKGRKMGW
jgi:hypothetical protein